MGWRCDGDSCAGGGGLTNYSRYLGTGGWFVLEIEACLIVKNGEFLRPRILSGQSLGASLMVEFRLRGMSCSISIADQHWINIVVGSELMGAPA